MSEQAKNKPATAKQIAYIKRLQEEVGLKKDVIKKKMSSFEASEIISMLIVMAQQKSMKNDAIKKLQINEPRLGMAMKECFKVRINHGWDIYEKHREDFIDEVINTYNLFTEIGEKLARNMLGAAEALTEKGVASSGVSEAAVTEKAESVI